jgi:hypothetical protein
VIALSIEAGVGGAELEDVVEEGIDVGAAMTSVSIGNETVAALSESVVENATYQLSPQCRSSELQHHLQGFSSALVIPCLDNQHPFVPQ